MSAPLGSPWDEQSAAARDKPTWHLAGRWPPPTRCGLHLRPSVRRWLIDSGFATVERDGTLQPTPLGVEIGRALAATDQL
jgi:hypothetical protein